METRVFSLLSDLPERFLERARRHRPGLLLGAFLALAAACARGQSIDLGVTIPGTRSLYVLDLPFLHFGPVDVAAPPPGKVAFDFEVGYGNTFSHTWHPQAIHNEFQRNGLPFSLQEAETLHARHSQDFIAFVDADVTRLALRVALGLGENLSIAAEIPYVSFAAFRLDSAVAAFHRLFGLYDEQRASFPKNQYLIVRQRPFGPLEYDDRTPAAGFSDAVTTLKYRGSLPNAVAVSADLSVKAPTGDANEGRGSGSADAGLLLGALRRFGTDGRLGLRAEAGFVVPGSFRGKSTTTYDVAAFGRVLLAADVRIGTRTFLAASAIWEQSPFRRDSVGDEAAASLGVSLGLSRRFGDSVIASLSLLDHVPRFGDDTDFSVSLGLKVAP
jgi:hypothetical protein